MARRDAMILDAMVIHDIWYDAMMTMLFMLMPMDHGCSGLYAVMWCWIQFWFDAYASGLMLCLVADVFIGLGHDVMVLLPGWHSWYARYHGVIQNVFIGCYAVEYTSCYWGVLDAYACGSVCWGCSAIFSIFGLYAMTDGSMWWGFYGNHVELME